MPERDTASQALHDLLSAFGLLTRLPLPQTSRHRPEAAWAWPLVGLGVGAVSVLPVVVLMRLGVTPETAAVLVVILGLFATGAMHEDGLADSADGLFGGWTVERRLEIMKDSHIGSYGTLALISVLLAVWTSYSDLLSAGHWPSILAAMVLSRAPMAVLMTIMPNARQSGLSSTVGRPKGWAAFASVGIAIAVASLLLADVWAVTKLVIATASATVVVGFVAHRKIRGQTGDILGAAQQITLLCAVMATQM